MASRNEKVDDDCGPTPQLPGETSKSYSYFLVYRDMGRWRSLEKLRIELNRREADRQSIGGNSSRNRQSQARRHLERLSAKHQWANRVQSYDLRMDRLRQAKCDEAAFDEQRLWESRRNFAMHETWRDAQTLRARAREMIAFPLTSEERDVDGKTIIRPARWTLASVAVLLNISSQLEQTALAAASPEGVDRLSDVELEGIESVIPGPPEPSDVELDAPA